jgi:hypothetical protein
MCAPAPPGLRPVPFGSAINQLAKRAFTNVADAPDH